MCDVQTSFELRRFLQEVIDDKIMPVHAYNKKMLKEAQKGKKNEFYKIIEYCLKFLQSNQLLTKTYLPTQRLKSICPLINQILMPGIMPLLNAEKEIRRDPKYTAMVKLLIELKRARKLDQYDIGKFIETAELSKMVRHGLVTLYMNGKLEMTTLGKLALHLFE
jgi:hypothetical protein